MSSPGPHDLQRLLREADEFKSTFQWAQAADTFTRAAEASVQENKTEEGRLIEEAGLSLCRAANQAQSYEDFLDKVNLAAKTYEKASQTYSRLDRREARAAAKNCQARELLAKSRKVFGSEEKKVLLDKSLGEFRNAISEFELLGRKNDSGLSGLGLLESLRERLDIEVNGKIREEITGEGVETGTRIIQTFDDMHSQHDLVEALVDAAYFNKHGAFARSQPKERLEERRRNAVSYLEKAVSIAEELKDSRLLSKSYADLGWTGLDLFGGFGFEERPFFEKALSHSEVGRDHRVIGDTLFALAWCEMARGGTEEDIGKFLEGQRNLERFCDQAVEHYGVVGYSMCTPVPSSFIAGSPVGGPLLERLVQSQTHAKDRQALLSKLRSKAESALRLAKEASSPG